ncbi:unnamed protein product [Symbiodinium sp. CCMP2592]|nr:unnamed protein product [Symbiodinium sp. CCMP2592]
MSGVVLALWTTWGQASASYHCLRMPWTPLPRELKVHCLRLLHASDVLACGGSCRVDFAAVDAEELWALLFHRDWRWLCADGPCSCSSSRQSHRRLSEKVGSCRAAFVVLGGCVRRDDGGRHEDGVATSMHESAEGFSSGFRVQRCQMSGD